MLFFLTCTDILYIYIYIYIYIYHIELGKWTSNMAHGHECWVVPCTSESNSCGKLEQKAIILKTIKTDCLKKCFLNFFVCGSEHKPATIFGIYYYLHSFKVSCFNRFCNLYLNIYLNVWFSTDACSSFNHGLCSEKCNNQVFWIMLHLCYLVLKTM